MKNIKCISCNKTTPKTSHNVKRCRECDRKRATRHTAEALASYQERERIYKRLKRKIDPTVLIRERQRKDEAYKMRERAGRALRDAVRAGKVKRPDTCEKCNKKPVSHHPDYSKPLSVRWLCASHHRLIHCKK